MIVVAVALMLPALCGMAQTTRGDYDYDGQTTVADVTAVIDYLLYGTWGDQPGSVQRDTIHISQWGGYDIVMVHVTGGSYSLGEGITATVGDFWIAQTEVTMGLWKAVMGSTPSSIYVPGMDYPASNVSWEMCQEFITNLNELTGRTFRLPYESEWEYAAKGGRLTHAYKYAGSDDIDQVAWYKENSVFDGFMYDIYLQPVATKAPNELGLYDMSGNVEEWCHDYNGRVGEYAVACGGNYLGKAEDCGVEHWTRYAISKKLYEGGLRLAL